jgi:ATP-dependent Clp protease ATP-binding subunit ClpA
VNTFGSYVQTIIEQAGHHARADGSAAIEAQHLLLAVAAQEGTAAQQVLTSVGLDQRAIRDALDREFEHSLRAAGVSRAGLDLPRPGGSQRGSARIGASTRLALERGVATAARKQDLQPAHLLLGILETHLGTVPRALALAGIDRADLAARVRQALGDRR